MHFMYVLLARQEASPALLHTMEIPRLLGSPPLPPLHRAEHEAHLR